MKIENKHKLYKEIFKFLDTFILKGKINKGLYCNPYYIVHPRLKPLEKKINDLFWKMADENFNRFNIAKFKPTKRISDDIYTADNKCIRYVVKSEYRGFPL